MLRTGTDARLSLGAVTSPPPAALMLASMHRLLECAGMVLILADASGRPVGVPPSDACLRSLGLSLWGQRLAAGTATATRAMRAAISRASGLEAASSLIAVDDRIDGPRLWIAPMPRAAEVTGEGYVMLVAAKASRTPEIEHLRDLFGLTPAEARLLCGLAAGTRLETYARHAGVSTTTVKAHLRQLFAKTGAERQADLVRLVLGNPVMALAACRAV
jgi:DNA-binding CsgD family transcriptional regulator